jgi:hypothetical protein
LVVKSSNPHKDKRLKFAFFAGPGSGIIQEIVGDIFIYAFFADVNQHHAFDLAKDHQGGYLFLANETPARDILLVKPVGFFIIVLHRLIESASF